MSTICTECDIEFSRKDGMEQLIRIHRAVMRIHHHHQRRNTHIMFSNDHRLDY
jgi:hypothetical protein